MLGHVGTCWDMLEHVGTCWDILGHLGTSWDMLGHLGTLFDLNVHSQMAVFWNIGYQGWQKGEKVYSKQMLCRTLAPQTQIWLWQVAVVMFSISRNKWRSCQGVKRNCRIFPAINFKWKWPNFENKSLLSRNGPTNHLSIKMHMHTNNLRCLWVSKVARPY